MPRHDKQARTYMVHPEHAAAAHAEKVGKLKAERAKGYRAIHASGAHVAIRPLGGRAASTKKAATE